MPSYARLKFDFFFCYNSMSVKENRRAISIIDSTLDTPVDHVRMDNIIKDGIAIVIDSKSKSISSYKHFPKRIKYR
jgi:hypothetical protein